MLFYVVQVIAVAAHGVVTIAQCKIIQAIDEARALVMYEHAEIIERRIQYVLHHAGVEQEMPAVDDRFQIEHR